MFWYSCFDLNNTYQFFNIKLLKVAVFFNILFLAPLGKTHAQTQASSKQIVTTLSQNPYQTTIDSVAKTNSSFSPENIKIISQYADYIDNFQIDKAEELYANNPIIKSYLKLFPWGGKLRKDYLAIKNGGEEMIKKIDESNAKKKENIAVKIEAWKQIDIEKDNLTKDILVDLKKTLNKQPLTMENRNLILKTIYEVRKNTDWKFEKQLQEIESQLK